MMKKKTKQRRNSICLFSSSTVGNKCLSASVLQFSRFFYLTTSRIVISLLSRSLSLSLLLFLAPRQFLKNSNNKRKRKKRKVYGCRLSLSLPFVRLQGRYSASEVYGSNKRNCLCMRLEYHYRRENRLLK